jgi:hypothetical protein
MEIHFDPITISIVPNSALNTLIQTVKELQMAISDVTSALAQLQSDVTAETTVNQSAITLIQGFPALLAAAIAAATAAGATPAQLQSFTDLSTGIEAQTTALAAAVTAGTPPPPAGTSGVASALKR